MTPLYTIQIRGSSSLKLENSESLCAQNPPPANSMVLVSHLFETCMRVLGCLTQCICSDGHIVAIKNVPRPDFVLNNSVRKEVLQIRLASVNGTVNVILHAVLHYALHAHAL